MGYLPTVMSITSLAINPFEIIRDKSIFKEIIFMQL